MDALSLLVATVNRLAQHPESLAEANVAGRLEQLALEARMSLDASPSTAQHWTAADILSIRLFEAPSVQAICEAMGEALVNFVGTEDFVLWVRDASGTLRVEGGMGPSHATALTAGAVPSAEKLLLLAPLGQVAGESVGVLAIASLLTHRAALGEEDRALLSVLLHRAGIALAARRSGRVQQVLLFMLETQRFALGLESLREVLRAAWPRVLPGVPFSCLGALDVRGEWVPLLDTSALLGLRRPRPSRERCFIPPPPSAARRAAAAAAAPPPAPVGR